MKAASLRALTVMALAAPIVAAGTPAHAIPTLQLYVEGATYDATTETWIGSPGADGQLRVWAIGTASAGGGQGTTTALKMTNLRMSILFGATSNEGNDGEGLPISLVAADTTFGGFADSWGAADIGDAMARTSHIVTAGGDQLDTVLIGAKAQDFLPIIAGSDKLSSHGEFTEGRLWQEYNLPDMDFLGGNLTSITDFNGNLTPPVPNVAKKGILYAFTIDTKQFAGSLNWHFDLYGELSETKQTTRRECTGTRSSRVCNDVPVFNTSTQNKFAPFSHDGGGVRTSVVEPGSLSLLGLGLVGLGLRARRRA